MLSVNIVCVGKLKEKYFEQAVAEYAKRLSAFCRFTVVEVNEERVGNNPSDAQINAVINAEGERILQKISPNAYVIALCVEGELLSSEQLSEKIAGAGLRGKSSIQFVIGGSWGLSDAVKRASSLKLSMGRLTFPHQLARVMVCEQIYRAFQIINNGKYHK